MEPMPLPCASEFRLRKRDEVSPIHTAVATVAEIEQAGCTTVFADIDPVIRCIDPHSIEQESPNKTRAIMPVHIYGQPAEMHKILEIAQTHNLAVVEDCSQAHGAEIDGQKVGTICRYFSL